MSSMLEQFRALRAALVASEVAGDYSDLLELADQTIGIQSKIEEEELPPRDTVRVFRLITYTGHRDMVEDAIRRSIHGEKIVTWGSRVMNGKPREMIICVTTLGEFPEIMTRGGDGEST